MNHFIVFLNNTINKHLNSIGLKGGYANGYVAIFKNHPYYGKSYDEIDINVHGGLTFSESGDKTKELFKDIEWIEGDIKELNKDWWIFGFDTCHYMDSLENWPKEAVIAETINLKKQLEGTIIT